MSGNELGPHVSLRSQWVRMLPCTATSGCLGAVRTAKRTRKPAAIIHVPQFLTKMKRCAAARMRRSTEGGGGQSDAG